MRDDYKDDKAQIKRMNDDLRRSQDNLMKEMEEQLKEYDEDEKGKEFGYKRFYFKKDKK